MANFAIWLEFGLMTTELGVRSDRVAREVMSWKSSSIWCGVIPSLTHPPLSEPKVPCLAPLGAGCYWIRCCDCYGVTALCNRGSSLGAPGLRCAPPRSHTLIPTHARHTSCRAEVCKAYVPPDFSLGLIGLSLSTLFVMNEVLLLGWLMLVAMLVVLIRVQGRSLAERAAVRRQAGRDESWFRQVELGRWRGFTLARRVAPWSCRPSVTLPSCAPVAHERAHELSDAHPPVGRDAARLYGGRLSAAMRLMYGKFTIRPRCGDRDASRCMVWESRSAAVRLDCTAPLGRVGRPRCGSIVRHPSPPG